VPRVGLDLEAEVVYYEDPLCVIDR